MSRRPNLLVIQTDQQNSWTLGAYGGTLVETPNIDRIATEGAHFDNFFTNSPVCTPSRGCLVSGLYPHRHGFLHWDARIDPGIETVFRPFAAAGYAVASFVFDESYLFRDMPEASVLGETTTLDGAIAWLRANADRPFFLFIHSWATHMPYDVRHAQREDWRAAKRQMLETIRANTADGLHRCLSLCRQRGTVVLFSDLFDNEDQLIDQLAQLRAAGHEVLAIHVIDPWEFELPAQGQYEFEDLETQSRLKVDVSAIGGPYRQAVQAWQDSIQDQFVNAGIDWLTCRTDQPLVRLLTEFLGSRCF